MPKRQLDAFFKPRVLLPKNRMHIALSPCWVGGGVGNVNKSQATKG
jgi:hypothetical protein